MAFDTLSYARRLRGSGFSDEQAETLADAARDIFAADFSSNFATKADLAALEHRLTLRIGSMMIVGFGLMIAVLGFLIRAH